MYEAPSRRQHFRVSAPAEVTIGNRSFPTRDWSCGGFSLDRFDGPAMPGDRVSIQFSLDFQGFAISFPGEAKVLRRNGEFLAAEFVNLGDREHQLLRYFTSALVSGQMVPVDNVLKSLDRPVTKIAINPPPVAQAPVRHALRRILIALIYLVVGLAILGFAFYSLAGQVTQLNVETAVTSAP